MPYGKTPDGRQLHKQNAIYEGPILVIDDDLDIREILSETLADLGFDVVAAANGRDALTLVDDLEVGPSVILLDLMMPVMDGYGFLEERAKDPKLASVPVAVVTAGHGIDERTIGDAIPVIRKPFEVSLLLDVLDRLRRRRKGLREPGNVRGWRGAALSGRRRERQGLRDLCMSIGRAAWRPGTPAPS